jgi:peptide-methionine (S)-S-oxide reductase
MEQATFGAGCFWCTEAVFQNLKGVTKVVSGYMGGTKPNPTYLEICQGNTGHAEVIQIEYDEAIISFDELLLVFFKTHDPTTRNRQGNDVGTQYRSVIFYYDQDQKQKAQTMIDNLTREMVFDRSIITEITPVSQFYEAEDYHQNYFNQNTNKPYCAFVIQPKLNKFIQEFRDKVQPGIL